MTGLKNNSKTTTTHNMNEQNYIELYQQHKEDICANGAEHLNQHREDFFLRWSKLGFPTTRNDQYKHCNLNDELAIDYGLNLKQLNLSQGASPFQCAVPGIQSHLCFVVNDTFVHTQQEQLPEGVVLCSLRQAAKEHAHLLQPYLTQLTQQSTDEFALFNGAFAQDGLFLYVPDNLHMERPIQLVNVMNAPIDFMANSHNLVIVGKNAKAQLVVCDHIAGTKQYFSNRVTEVFVQEGAQYEHYKLESTGRSSSNVCSLLVKQEKDSSFLGNIITLHNGKTRNNIDISLAGKGCNTNLCGMVIGDGHQLIDNNTRIIHQQSDCTSNELFKYILSQQSNGVFNGLLKVMPDAQRTSANQTNRNILLTDSARIHTQPQLEIYADDVKCSHGATTGQLDEQALFYMQQRGIAQKEAKLLLMTAFVNDVIENIHIPSLQDKIRLLVDKRLRGEDTKCQTCKACH